MKGVENTAHRRHVAQSSKSAQRPNWFQQTSIIALTLMAVSITVFIGSRAYNINRLTALDQFSEQQLILARSAAAGVATYFSEVGLSLRTAANVDCVRKLKPEVVNYMKRMYSGFLPKTSIRRIDEKGILRYIYPNSGWRTKITGDHYGEETFFRNAISREDVILSGIVINEQGDKRIRMAVPVYVRNEKNKGRKLFKGVLAVSFDLTDIGKTFISPIVSGQTGYAWLMNGEGLFLAHNEKEFVGQDVFKARAEKSPSLNYESINKIQRRILDGREGVGRYVSGWHRGRTGIIEKLIAYSPVRILDQFWSVAVCAPVDEVDRIIRTAGLNALFSFGFIVLIVIIAGIFISFSSYRWSQTLEKEVTLRTKELAETTTYLNNLIRCANAPVVVLDPDRKITIFNQAFEKMSGRSEEEMTGRTMEILFPEENRKESLEKIRRAVVGEKEWKGEEILILSKEEEPRIGLWNSANIYSEDGSTLVATIAHGQDVTDRRKLEAQLRHAQKMETLGTLVAGVAHEINNPINQIIFNIPLLIRVWNDVSPELKKIRKNKPEKKYGGLTYDFLEENLETILTDMDMAASRIAQTVNNLKDFSRHSNISDKKAMFLDTAINNAVRLIQTTLRKSRISLEVHLSESPLIIHGHLQSIEEIIMNLLINAANAIENENGIIMLVTGIEKNEKRCFIAVSDNGKGIEPSISSKLFDPFFTTRQAEGGTGLGLSITFNLVEAHGGEISFHSHKGKGTTFMVFFPMLKKEEESS